MDSRNEQELLKAAREQSRLLERQLKAMRLTAAFLGAALVLLLACSLALIPRYSRMLGQMEEVSQNLTAVSEQLKDSDLQSMLENVNQLVVTTEKTVSELETIIRPLSRLLGNE